MSANLLNILGGLRSLTGGLAGGRAGGACRTVIGVDLGSRRLKAVQAARTPGGLRVVAAAVSPRTGAGASKALLTPEEAAGLSNLLWRGGFEGTRVVLAAPAGALVHSVLELPPRASGAPVEQIARLEMARSQKASPDTFEMGCWDLPAAPRAGKAAHVMAVALPHAEGDALLDMLEPAGLRVEAMDVAACALARACAPLAAADDSSPAAATALLDVGWGAAALTLLYKGAVVYTRALPECGLAELHGSIGRRLDLDADAVECLLTEGAATNANGTTGAPDGSDLPEEARRILSSHADGLCRELEMSFSYASHLYPDAGVAGLRLVGGGAMLPGLAERLTTAVGVPAAPVAPTHVAACEPGLLSLCASPTLTMALGLAMYEGE